ncbi:MAG: DNA polymerase III subunit delta' C-terminal domain-containing protein [Legionella sp.]
MSECNPSGAGKKKYPKQWCQIQSAWGSGRMPQAMMFVGSFDAAYTDFVTHFKQLLFCNKKGAEPCRECTSCQMVLRDEHPDVILVKPEKNGGPIKIDQIRALQNDVYLTPQCAQHHLIVIESADRMNTAAANSLLKILEEPTQHTVFLLLARQISTVLPTVLSRCQIVRFSSSDYLSSMNLLGLVNDYPEDSGQALIAQQSELILDGLIAVIENKEHPCAVAAQWSQFEIGFLLWFLYLVYAQLQLMQINSSVSDDIDLKQLTLLASLLSPIMIFTQIDKINTLQRKLSHNINVNQTLALEDLLLSLQNNIPRMD